MKNSPDGCVNISIRMMLIPRFPPEILFIAENTDRQKTGGRQYDGHNPLGTACCRVPLVGMIQMRPREDPGASREGKGMLSEME